MVQWWFIDAIAKERDDILNGGLRHAHSWEIIDPTRAWKTNIGWMKSIETLCDIVTCEWTLP